VPAAAAPGTPAPVEALAAASLLAAALTPTLTGAGSSRRAGWDALASAAPRTVGRGGLGLGLHGALGRRGCRRRRRGCCGS
jgi:hypothetical protein